MADSWPVFGRFWAEFRVNVVVGTACVSDRHSNGMAPEYGLWRLDAVQRRPASLVADLLATGITLRGNTIMG